MTNPNHYRFYRTSDHFNPNGVEKPRDYDTFGFWFIVICGVLAVLLELSK